jgi:hypothetical protein
VEQTDADRLSGILRLRFGSAEKEIPALPLRPAREWVNKLVAGFDGVITRAASEIRDNPDVTFLNVPFLVSQITHDTAIDLVLAYDRGDGIGGRDWLEDNATPRQVKEALEVMHSEALPFDGEAQTVSKLLIQAAVQSLARSSTSSPSPTGDLRPVPSNRASRRGSSRSSGKQARSA